MERARVLFGKEFIERRRGLQGGRGACGLDARERFFEQAHARASFRRGREGQYGILSDCMKILLWLFFRDIHHYTMKGGRFFIDANIFSR